MPEQINLVEAILSVSWPDGGHDGFPTRRIAEMLAEQIAPAVLVRLVAEAQEYHDLCHAERKAWRGRGQPDAAGRADLWLSRAEAMSAFIAHLEEKQ